MPNDSRASTTLSSGAGDESGGHPAIDFASAILRAIGRFSVDTDQMSAQEVTTQCEQWARHLSVGAPAPGARENSKEENGGTAFAERSWDGARRFVTEVLRQEQTFVSGRMNDFRDMVWVLMQGMRATLMEEQAADAQMSTHLDRIKEALAGDSIDALRREVLAGLMLIGRVQEERRRHQRRQLEQMGSQLRAMRDALLDAQQEMSLDSMTRLYNRAAFDQMLAKTAELSLFAGQSACLMMIDVDHFKRINDERGHPAGDAVVRKLAETLTRSFPRKSDFVARYAGDEFAVILQDTTLKEGRMLAERLLKNVRSLRVEQPEAEEFGVTLSIGVASLVIGDTAESWLRAADEALYEAKQQGRDRVAGAERADA